jgi:hypothetical protein
MVPPTADQNFLPIVDLVLEHIVPLDTFERRSWREFAARLSEGKCGSQVRFTRHCVVWRLPSLLIKKSGRNLRTGQADRWTRTWFHDQGLHKLMGTIRYPTAV